MPGSRDRRTTQRTTQRSASRRSLRFSFALPFVVPALLLTGLWGYTAAGLLDEQSRLRADMERASSAGRPAEAVMSRLQDERRLTAAWQAARSDSTRTALDNAREATDTAVEEFDRTSPAGLDTTTLKSRARALGDALDTLSERRDAVDKRTLSATETFDWFTETVAHGQALLTTATRTDDGTLSRTAFAATSLAQLTEMFSREDAVLAGALPADKLEPAARARFGQYVAVQRDVRATLDARGLPAGRAAAFDRVTGGAEWSAVAAIEDAVATGGGNGLPGDAKDWPEAAASVVDDLRGVGAGSLDDLTGSGSDRANTLLIGLILSTVVTVLFLVGGAILALRLQRSVLGRLATLHRKTEELGTDKLPQLLARLERGERVEPTVMPAERPGDGDEMERIDAAVDQLGRVVQDAVVHQSRGREGTEKVFAQLIRRTQILIHRLISLLDDLERKHEDSDLLKDIFKVDHLATRVRRHSENLVILSGSPPSRRMTQPVPITDVMRSAVAETEQYTRVKVKNLPVDRQLSLTGRAVADVTHLVAELIENGTSFSPPDTQVYVSATRVAKGLALHVEDHGLGMPEDMRARANHLLAHPPKLDMVTLGEDPRLGHFVVARLADRHQIKVELRESVYGGTLAIVLLPQALLEEHESPVLDQLRSAAANANRAIGTADDFDGISASGVTSVTSGGGGVLAGALVGADSLVGADALAGAGIAGGAGLTGGTTHVKLPDHSGFPEYGGAGLLPAASGHTAAPAPVPEEWTPGGGHPGGGHPVSREHPAPHAYPAPDGGTTHTYPGPDSGQARPDAGRGRAVPGHGSGQGDDAPQPLTTPRVLPQRTRGASLAQQLRKEAAEAPPVRQDSDGDTGLSPDLSARAMTAIQQGLQRARISEVDDSTGTDGRTESRGPGAN
ncbi:nitrate- and nitrite sensing domain-containing protein [Streptomyces sp. NPDC091292]|uniref:sensor histidine kinase n=1 Tax=Streptomyces sp. NPDC091292 TaxID=3365991 RepID=UPI00382D5855